ncbi:MAG: glycosyltransferase [Gaiellaceae bacterium]
MSRSPTSRFDVLAFPAHTAENWVVGGPWGRDAHLIQAVAHLLVDEAPRIVVASRGRLWEGRRSRPATLGSVHVDVVDHPIEVPGWTRRRAAAAVSRRAAAAPVRLDRPASEGLVLCWDLMRWDSAWATARLHGWQLATDVIDDWRLHPSMCAWHRHLAGKVFPRFEGTGRTLSAVTSAAVAGARAPLVLPNAGYHAAAPPRPPGAGPRRPVAAYVGTIHRKLDVAAFARLAADLREWDVVAVGPVMDEGVRDALVAAGIGIERWWDMAEIDRRATVVVCPYARTSYTASMDPLKIYESLARGVPCVTTVPITAGDAEGLAVVEPDELADAVVALAATDRSVVAEAGLSLGSWESRAGRLLEATGVLPERLALEGMR